MEDLFGNPDEDAIYVDAISAPLDEKIRKAVAIIKEYGPAATQTNVFGYRVGDSFGKDSSTIIHLCKLACVDYKAFYGNTTLDHPLVHKFRKEHRPTTEMTKPVNIRHEKHKGKNTTVNFYHELEYHASGLPTRMGKWCCDVYKHNHGKGYFSIIGIRAEESKKRKATWHMIQRDGESIVMCPILYWTEEDVWNFHAKYNLPHCELYDPPYNMKRVGCFGVCPMAGKKRKTEFDMYPYAEKMAKKHGRKVWEKYSKLKTKKGEDYFLTKFKTFEEYWSWWMEEEDINTDQQDCQMWMW